METRGVLVLAIVAILGSTGAAEAQEKHFTFNVPVEVRGLLPDALPVVFCAVRSDASDAIGSGFGSFQTDTNGDFSGTVVVGFDAFSQDGGKDPALATQFECSVRHKVSFANYCIIGKSNSPDECRADPDESLMNPVTGQIP